MDPDRGHRGHETILSMTCMEVEVVEEAEEAEEEGEASVVPQIEVHIDLQRLKFRAHQPHPILSQLNLPISILSSAIIGSQRCLIRADLQRSWRTMVKRMSR